MNKFYVYIHFNPISKIPFYVGKGCNKRYKNISNRSIHWKRYYNKYGCEPVIIENNLSEDDAYYLEKYWISQLKQWGFSLVNKTDGGDGCNWWYGKKRPDISEKFKGHKVSDETKNKISLSNKGKRNSIDTEFKKGMSPKHKGISKYDIFLNGRPGEYRECKNCNNKFIARIDKPTIFCGRSCYNKYKINNKRCQ